MLWSTAQAVDAAVPHGAVVCRASGGCGRGEGEETPGEETPARSFGNTYLRASGDSWPREGGEVANKIGRCRALAVLWSAA